MFHYILSRGWGLRCLDDIPKGTFVCTYSGDIHTDDSADEVCNYHPRGDEYFAELDYIGECTSRDTSYSRNLSQR